MIEEEVEEEAASPKIPLPVPDSVPAPDEEDRDDSDDDNAAIEPATAATHAPDPEPPQAATEDTDRWAGTMSHEWNEKDDAPAPEAPKAAASRPKTKQKPKITLEEAVGQISPEALRYIREKFKTDVNHIRMYDPANSVKTQ